MFIFDLIQTNRVNLQSSNRANTDNFFPAFLHSDKTHKSEFRLLSISTPSNFVSYFFRFSFGRSLPKYFRVDVQKLRDDTFLDVVSYDYFQTI